MGIFNKSYWFGDNSEGTKVSVFNIGESFDNTRTTSMLKEAYSNNGDVYSIIKKISDNAKSIPRELWEKKGDEWEQVFKGDLWKIVTQQPNKHQNISDFVEASITNLLSTGNAFRRGTKSIGFGEAFQEIIMLNNDFITLECKIEDFRYVPKTYKISVNNQTLTLNPEDINHVKFYNPSSKGAASCLGLSPLQAGMLSLVANHDNKTAQSVIVRNQGIRGMITSRSDRAMTEPERKQIQEAADMRMVGAKKFGKALTTSANVDWVQMGMNPTQLKILESSVLTLRDLCNIYGVDSSLFNDPANKTYNNRKEAEKAMWTNAVIPVNEKDILTLSQWLLPAWNENDKTTYQIRQNLSSIPVLHEDENRRAQKQETISKILISILASELTPGQKIQTLMRSLDFDEEEAKNIVTNAE